MSLLLRKLKLTSTFWISADKSDAILSRRILNDESLKALIDQDFIRAINERKQRLEVALSKLWGVQFPLLMFFVFMLIPISAEVSLFGISPHNAQGFREIALLIWATVAVHSSYLAVQKVTLDSLLKAHVTYLAGGNKNVEDALKLRYGISLIWIPASPKGIFYTRRNAVLFSVFVVTTTLFTLMFFIITSAIPLLALIDTWRHPVFGPWATWVVIVYAILGEVVSISSVVVSLAPLPQTRIETDKLLAIVQEGLKALQQRSLFSPMPPPPPEDHKEHIS